MENICVIDIGTNSMLCLCVENKDGVFKESDQKLKTIGLGKYINDQGELSRECVDVVSKTLVKWYKDIEKKKVDKIIAVGTHIFRKAVNREQICSLIEKSSGIKIKIISEYEEACYSFLGTVWNRRFTGRVLVVDIGGGSTEFVISENQEIIDLISINLGAVTSTLEFIKDDPPDRENIEELHDYVQRELSRNLGRDFIMPDTLLCTGGTATTLAGLKKGIKKYDGIKIDGLELNYEEIFKLEKKLASSNFTHRRKFIQFDPDRAEVIIAGTVILSEIMKFTGKKRCIVSDRGLRFGIAVHELSEQKFPC